MSNTPANGGSPPPLEELLTRTQKVLGQTLVDAARAPAQQATRFVSRKLLGVTAGVLLMLAAITLLLTGLVLIVSQYVPLWATCIGAGVLTLLIGTIVLQQTNK